MARLILLVLVTVMPWWYGGAQWQAQWWVVVGGIALAILTWLSTLLSPRRTGGFVHLSIVMVIFLGWVGLELIPLPQFMASQLSGAGRFVQSIIDQSGVTSEQAWLQPESYNKISIGPLQTKASMAVYAVAVVVVWSASTLFIGKTLTIVLAATLALGECLTEDWGLLSWLVTRTKPCCPCRRAVVTLRHLFHATLPPVTTPRPRRHVWLFSA